MQITASGLKKPDLIDNADLQIFIGDNMDLLETLLANKSNIIHGHDAGDVVSGVFSSLRIPNLDMSKITSGNLNTGRLSEPSYIMGSITKTAKPLFDVLRADRTAFLPAEQIIIEQSTDGGITWTDAGIPDSTKSQLFTGQRPHISIPLKNGVKNTDCMLRITITGMKYNVPSGTLETDKYNYWNSTYVQSTERYFRLEDGWAWVGSVYDRVYCKIERATGANPTNWVTDRELFTGGWPRGNYFSLSGNTFGGETTQVNNYWNWRFTFRTATTALDFDNAKLSTLYQSYPQIIYHIKLTGVNVWVIPNKMMYHDHLYDWDENQNAIFPAEIEATTFRKNDGTEVSYEGHTHNYQQPISVGNIAPSNPVDKQLWIDTSV